MIRDTRSYETQIIDAVRSVNRALGGTYGTSPAIYNNDFDQYQVQLIDAIKGIGRTLSGNGLSLAGGGLGGVSAEEFESLSRRVTKLENESFFRLVNGNVTLKDGYSNLWVPGWLAAGGVGTGGGGGGVSYLKELTDVYHSSSGILRANGDPVSNGDILVYDSTNQRWNAAANSGGGGGSGTVTGIKVGTASYSPDVSGVVSLPAYPTSSTVSGWGFTKNAGTVTSVTLTSGTGITVSNSGTAITSSGSRTIGISSTYQGYISHGETAYGWGDHSLAGYASASDLATLAGRVTSIEDWFEVVNVAASGQTPVYALHAKNSYAIYSDSWIAAGGIGSGSGGGGGATSLNGLSDVSISSRSNGDVLSFNSALGYWVNTPKNTYLSGYATTSDLTAKQDKIDSSHKLDYSLIANTPTIPTVPANVSAFTNDAGYITSSALSGYLPLTGGTLTGNLTMSGANILSASDNSNAIGATSTRFSQLHVRNIYTSYLSFRDGTTPTTERGIIGIGDGYAQLTISGSSATNYMFYAGSGFFKSGGGVSCGRSDHRWSGVYSVNADLSGDLSMASTSTISIGPVSLSYDSTSKALHVSGTDGGQDVGFYCDGFVASGGIGSSGVVKYVHCATQSDYTAITTKDESTIYMIGTGAAVYLGTIQLYSES